MIIDRYRRIAAVALAAGLMCTLAACGSSSSSSSGSGSGSSSGSSSHSAAPGGAGGAGGFTLTASERACLKKHGVTLPSGGFGGRSGGTANGTPPSGGQGGAPGGKRPSGANGKLPKGKLPKGKFPQGARRGFAQSKAQQAAFKACGVTFTRPSGSQGGPMQTSTAG